MEFRKRLDYGFNGYQLPAIPRATRSTRRKSKFRNRCKDRAFDLLATVADELFHEKESPATSYDDSTGKDNCANTMKEWPKIEPVFETLSQITSLVANSDSSERIIDGSMNNNAVIKMESLACKIDVGLNCHKKFMLNCNVDGEDRLKKEDELDSGAGMDISYLENMDLNQKAQALVSSNNDCTVSLCRDDVAQSSYPANQEDVKVVGRDDDENTSGCTHPVESTKPFRPLTCNGNRMVRKVLPSKYWKVGPRCRDETCSNDSYLKPIYRNKRNSYKRQRSQMNIPFKKRKLFYSSSVSNSDGTVNLDGYSDSLRKRVKTDAYGTGTCTGTSTSIAGHRKLFQSRRDPHVKLKIRSFRVPELFIEIPETATIGSLKRTVMEAVTAILGRGLRVGVLLRGQKIRDDNKTLFQTGISHDNQLDSLGFTLEPTPSQASTPLCHGNSPPHMLLCDTMKPLTRYSPTEPKRVNLGTLVESDLMKPLTRYSPTEPKRVNLGTLVESDLDSAPSPIAALVEKSPTDCKQLVALDALTVVQTHRKLKQSEVVQRRIRRPFSVAEVEALVETVEKLGPGRWRDVKVCAFDNAKHRTYVDLKDKWKTLVHTARIAPQQRRGEPVPQELLDRVLAAQSYWSQHQPKLLLKHQPEACLLI